MIDRILAVVLLSLGGMYAALAWKLEIPFQYEPLGPKAWPLLLATILAICAVVIALRPDPPPSWPGRVFAWKAFGMLLALEFYAVFFEQLGFMITTTLVSFVLALLIGAKPLPAAAVALALAVIGYYGATEALQLNLPFGQIFQ